MTTEQSDGACTPSFSSAELERFSFADLCKLLPADVHWGDHLTPDILREVAMAVESREREACAACVPSNWLDPLLTGPKRVIGDVSDIRPIEAVLGATKARIMERANT